MFKGRNKKQQYHIQFQDPNGDWSTKRELDANTPYAEARKIFNTYPAIFAAKRLATVITTTKALIKVNKIPTKA